MLSVSALLCLCKCCSMFFSFNLICTLHVTCSGQRIIVQEKNEEQVVENVVTIQVRQGRKI